MENKFDYYEIVKIKSGNPELSDVNGLKGAVLGISESEDSKQIAYSVHIFKLKTSWFIFEEDLKPTGMKANPEDFYTGESIKVRVDPKTGEGEIVEDDED